MGHSPNNTNMFKIPPLIKAEHYVLAFSGGSDSAALLHYLAHHKEIKKSLSAVHVNHQIHSDSNLWAEQCLDCCRRYQIPCIVKNISSDKQDENSLREARYKVIAQHIKALPGTTVLLTAHHLNDDVETLLFRLLRGTGLNGLTGMTQVGHFHNIRIFRPLINTPKSIINQYLQEHNIKWIQDSSNQNTDYDRNYIRHQIIPELLGLRPDALQRIKDTRDNLTASLTLLEQLIVNDNPLPLNHHLSVDSLATLLYHWLAKQQLNPAKRCQLISFATACLQSESDKMPTLHTNDYVLKTWQQAVYALSPQLLAIDINQSHQLVNDTDHFVWQHELGRLTIHAKQRLNIRLTVVFNEKGKKIQLPARKHHNRIKEILREHNIPPWQRKRLPYVYHNQKLMAVGPIISHDWQQWLTAHNAEYDWQSTHFIL